VATTSAARRPDGGTDRAPRDRDRATSRPVERARETGPAPGRRTVTIRGQVAPPSRATSTTLIIPARRPPRRAVERIGSRPDRVAMYAVVLGVLLVLAAALSAH
jgi:hypothetical protein